MFEKYVWPYRKAFVAGILAGVAMLYTDLPSGVTGQEWLEVLVTAATTAAGVWGIKNAPKPPSSPQQ